MTRNGSILLVAILLAGCTQLQKFTVTDLTGAAALAQAAGDQPGAACWNSLIPIVNAVTGTQIGTATLIEAKRVLTTTAAGPQCAMITASAFLDLLSLGSKVAVPGL